LTSEVDLFERSEDAVSIPTLVRLHKPRRQQVRVLLRHVTAWAQTTLVARRPSQANGPVRRPSGWSN
jgi:hypothetical protein